MDDDVHLTLALPTFRALLGVKHIKFSSSPPRMIKLNTNESCHQLLLSSLHSFFSHTLMVRIVPFSRSQLSRIAGAARQLCSSSAIDTASPTKSIANQNEERARQYLQRYSSQGDAFLDQPLSDSTPMPKKSIPVITGNLPDVNLIAKQLEDAHGAYAISTLDVRVKAHFADWMVVCCGRTERHVRAIADGIKDDMRQAGVRVGGDMVGICGRDDPDWMAVDVGPIVVHVMTNEARDHYDLEGLWMPERVVGPEEYNFDQ